MASTLFKISVVISVLIAVWASYLYRRHVETNRVTAVLAGLLKAESAVLLQSQLRVAVGFGSCVDLIGPGLEILDRVGAVPPDQPAPYDSLHDMDELQRIFAYYFQHGAAAERYMVNAGLFKNMSDEAQMIGHTKVAVGGNAPVMVNSFLREGAKVLLGAQMSDSLRQKIDPKVEVAGAQVDSDDIHLIMEYKKGQKWGKYEAPRSNRFIVHSDANNPMLSSLEEFGSALVSFSPHLVVIGGLQMMDSFPYLTGQRRQRLDVLAGILEGLPQETHVHFEMASFAETECLKDIIDTVILQSDSLGMNEQELPNLLGILSSGSITAVADAYPRVASTLDQMRELYRLLNAMTDTTGKGRRVTRIHVHTLAFQAIMTSTSSDALEWKNSHAAAARSSLAASRHTCGDRHVAVSRSRLLLDDSFLVSIETDSQRIALKPEEPVACWQEMAGDGEGSAAVEICLAPVLVCTEVVQTVGGGDNISTAGLVLQV